MPDIDALSHGNADPHAGGVLHVGTGDQYLVTGDGILVTGSATASHTSGSTSGTSTGGTGSPSSTLVGASTGLQINLVWDTSVQVAANWSAVESAVVQAAKIFTGNFANHAVINIAVGLGEVGGTTLAAGALGQSESNGYIESYSAMMTAMGKADAGLVSAGKMSSGALSATSALSSASFFVSLAEAKVLGFASATTTSIDGYIGLASGSSLYYPASGKSIGSTQYDAVGVAAHELSEVMGRTGMGGQALGTYAHVYTALDLFRYVSSGTIATSGAQTAYFSTNAGATNLQVYDNPSNGGDMSDWSSSTATKTDAFAAFATPGVTQTVTATDLLEVAVLGYQVVAGKTLANTAA